MTNRNNDQECQPDICEEFYEELLTQCSEAGSGDEHVNVEMQEAMTIPIDINELITGYHGGVEHVESTWPYKNVGPSDMQKALTNAKHVLDTIHKQTMKEIAAGIPACSDRTLESSHGEFHMALVAIGKAFEFDGVNGALGREAFDLVYGNALERHKETEREARVSHDKSYDIHIPDTQSQSANHGTSNSVVTEPQEPSNGSPDGMDTLDRFKSLWNAEERSEYLKSLTPVELLELAGKQLRELHLNQICRASPSGEVSWREFDRCACELQEIVEACGAYLGNTPYTRHLHGCGMAFVDGFYAVLDRQVREFLDGGLNYELVVDVGDLYGEDELL